MNTDIRGHKTSGNIPTSMSDCISNQITWGLHRKTQVLNRISRNLKKKKKLLKNFEELHMPIKIWMWQQMASFLHERHNSLNQEILRIQLGLQARSIIHPLLLCETQVLHYRKLVFFSRGLNDSDFILGDKRPLGRDGMEGIKEKKTNEIYQESRRTW